MWCGVSSNLPQGGLPASFNPSLSQPIPPLQSCEKCSGTFCQDCLPKNDRGHICKRCGLLLTELVEREELEKLSITNLHYVIATRGIQLPPHMPPDKATLVEAILIEQAQRLTDRALKAQSLLTNPGVLGERDWVSIPRRSSSVPEGKGGGSDAEFTKVWNALMVYLISLSLSLSLSLSSSSVLTLLLLKT